MLKHNLRIKHEVAFAWSTFEHPIQSSEFISEVIENFSLWNFFICVFQIALIVIH